MQTFKQYFEEVTESDPEVLSLNRQLKQQELKRSKMQTSQMRKDQRLRSKQRGRTSRKRFGQNIARGFQKVKSLGQKISAGLPATAKFQ